MMRWTSVGEGRAGKSAFANVVIGRPFEDTASTIGIGTFTCDIKYANVGGGGWSEYEKPDKEMEAAVANMIANGIHQASVEEDRSTKKQSSQSSSNHLSGRSSQQGQEETHVSAVEEVQLKAQIKKTRPTNTDTSTPAVARLVETKSSDAEDLG